ncbi:hypothetical protein BJV74DRAFT_285185 [Russula compacta]|nr:hypothetical protein BJV74DRAFT_285185 [Russula compacta]
MRPYQNARRPARGLLPRLVNSIAQCLFPSAGPSALMDCPPESSERMEPLADCKKGSGGQKGRHCVAIDMLPDEILLHIFEFYRRGADVYQFRNTWPWHRLMHVSRRWRQAVLESPLRLDVQLICKGNTPVKEYLDVFPALPIVISYLVDITWPDPRIDEGDNVIVALGHHNRVCQIHLDGLTSSLLGRLATAMHEPFPALTHLLLESSSETPPVLPDAFLGGSTPSLRSLDLEGIAFPALARLVISAGNLVSLRLWSIPDTGYVSPEAMANALSA